MRLKVEIRGSRKPWDCTIPSALLSPVLLCTNLTAYSVSKDLKA